MIYLPEMIYLPAIFHLSKIIDQLNHLVVIMAQLIGQVYTWIPK